MSDRRQFIKNSLSLGVTGSLLSGEIFTNPTEGKNSYNRIERPAVIFFDINETVLDLEPLKKSVNKIFDSSDLGTLWFNTMLEYSFATSLAHQYRDFGSIGAAAMVMIAESNGISLTMEKALQTVKQITNLPPHPDIKEGLQLLKNAGYKLVSFTNSSNNAVQLQLKNAGIAHFFDDMISVEDFGRFKPDRDVYDWAARKMKIANDQSLLVAAHGWDIAGALWAGWHGAFISRPGQQLFPLAPDPQFNKPDLIQLAQELAKLK